MSIFRFILSGLFVICSFSFADSSKSDLANAILNDSRLQEVKTRALAIMESGLNAGDGYSEVWIRDLNTFIELACDTHEHEKIKEQLLLFCYFQGTDGNIVDGLTKASKASVNYDYIRVESHPELLAHKNTVETDQESSLVQAVCRYARYTGDLAIFDVDIQGKKVIQRLEDAMNFLSTALYDKNYGLIWGATTADWGDVQPEHEWGVVLDDSSHKAIDIYDNAMYLVAIDELLASKTLDEGRSNYWKVFRDELAANVKKHLWDNANQKFIPHLYLGRSPFPAEFPENEVYFHGGTAVAIEAKLLNPAEVKNALEKMRANVKAAGAPTIGLTLYPPYPEGYFKNLSMSKPYSYQNGGDWTWFGGRMIQQLIQYGLIQEAYDELSPMLDRVLENNGFFEWYSRENKPRGSGTYRGEAGVLYSAINMLENWAKENS